MKFNFQLGINESEKLELRFDVFSENCQIINKLSEPELITIV